MVIKIVTFLILSLLSFTVFAAGGRTKLPGSPKSSDSADGICKSMVETQGYTCEEHKVTTKDGYIVGMQRIPTGRQSGKNNGAKIPVLLQHGIFADARNWLSNSPEESLGFILADNGFDVWLANARGTSSSSGHMSLSPSDPDYWNWSWDELALYDLPATVQYVYSQTGQKLHYVGHSLGTLMALAAFSRNMILNMTRSAALLSPIAHLGHLPSPPFRVAADAFIFEDFYSLGVKEFNLRAAPAGKLEDDICPKIDCNKLVEIATGPNCCLNSSIAIQRQLQPTATKNLVHLAQMIRRGTIAMYDYGNVRDNNKYYGQPTPPVYNMKSIPNNLPLLLAYGGKDLLSYVKDVQTLIDDLSEHDADKLVLQYRDDYAHLDFVLGVNANQVVYSPLMAFFKMN